MSVNDREAENQAKIREMLLPDLGEIKLKWCYANDPEQFKAAREKFADVRFRPDIWPMAKMGELGVWHSQMIAWDYIAGQTNDVLVLEDDAILDPEFVDMFSRYLLQLPDKYDFYSVYTPKEQYADFYHNYIWDSNGYIIGLGRPEYHNLGAPWYLYGSKSMCKVFQGYSCVATLFSPKGAAKLLERARVTGMTTPVDCWIFEQAHAGNVAAYSQKPDYFRIVEVNTGQSTIQTDYPINVRDLENI